MCAGLWAAGLCRSRGGSKPPKHLNLPAQRRLHKASHPENPRYLPRKKETRHEGRVNLRMFAREGGVEGVSTKLSMRYGQRACRRTVRHRVGSFGALESRRSEASTVISRCLTSCCHSNRYLTNYSHASIG